MSTAVNIPVDRLVKIYVRMREAKAAEVKAHDTRIKETYDIPMAQIATELKARAQAEGVEGFRTDFGTVYMATDFKASCADWGLLYSWLVENDALDFLERRLASGKIKDYMEAHDGELPPGVNVYKELQARVRKSGDK